MKGKISMVEFNERDYCDFIIKLQKGLVLPNFHEKYYENRADISIYNDSSNDYIDSEIQIEKTKYKINNNTFIKIKKIINENLNKLINWSIKQNNINLRDNRMCGGCAGSITIQYGRLTINVIGQVNDIGEDVMKIIDEIVEIIKSEGEVITLSIDEEFEKYVKLYEERFGKTVKIPEPGGTKEKVIDAIKICLEKDEDILDNLFFPNNNNIY